MHPAARLQFERIIEEYACWQAVPEAERSPAPAWWWGPAIELRHTTQLLPVQWCLLLDLPDTATYADGAQVLLGSFREQTSLPWPHDFPRKAEMSAATAVRELHPQPSDDSAFQP